MYPLNNNTIVVSIARRVIRDIDEIGQTIYLSRNLIGSYYLRITSPVDWNTTHINDKL